MKTKHLRVVALLVAILLVASCAAGPNQLAGTPGDDGDVAGFWLGLWHGIIAPVTFVISLFSDNVHMYDVHNNGGWYNFGFLFGATVIFGGSGGGAGRRRSRED